MTEAELQALIESASNPDTAAEALLDLSDKVKELIAANTKLTSDNATATETIAQLRDTNLRIALRKGVVSGSVPADQEADQKEISDMTRAELREFVEKRMEEANGNQ